MSNVVPIIDRKAARMCASAPADVVRTLHAVADPKGSAFCRQLVVHAQNLDVIARELTVLPSLLPRTAETERARDNPAVAQEQLRDWLPQEV